MRSSIACLRCRKSKIKCDNDGGNTPCDTCIKTGKNCQYPEPQTQPIRRPDPPVPLKREGDAPTSERKRLKKLDDVRLNSQVSASMYAADVLAAPYLTETLWTQCLDLFKLHFATELPFLHMPTLKERLGERLRNAGRQQQPASISAAGGGDAPDTNLLLLGILTLTARFHPDLVKYIAHTLANQAGASLRNRSLQVRTDGASATAASEYFADALTKALGPLRTSVALASVERVQAFLMLGLYEWSQSRPKTCGLGAWMYVGIATRMAQALGLYYGDRREPPTGGGAGPGGSTVPLDRRPPPLTYSELMTAREVRRRTMFSCFILDRLLSCGVERASILRADDLAIQLPCSDTAFDLSEDIRTGFLSMTEAQRVADGSKDSVLGRFAKLVDIWGAISAYSVAGGRLSDREPPWSEGSTYSRLVARLDDFYATLPPTFTLSTSNYLKHDNHQASTVYVSLHMMGCVCQIMLHREYMPYLPLRSDRPSGPRDDGTATGLRSDDVPDRFWLRRAERLFCSARQIVDLVEVCQTRDKLPLSGLVMFAVWTAAFVGIYAHHFPHMDQEAHMLSPHHPKHPQRQQQVWQPRQLSPGEDEEECTVKQQQQQPDDASPSGEAPATPSAPLGGDGSGVGGVEELVDISRTGPTGLAYQTLSRMAAWLQTAAVYQACFADQDRRMEAAKLHYHGCPQSRVDGVASSGRGGRNEWQLSEEAKFKAVNKSAADPATAAKDDEYEAALAMDRLHTPQSAMSLSFTPINSSAHGATGKPGPPGSTQQQQQQQSPGGGGTVGLGSQAPAQAPAEADEQPPYSDDLAASRWESVSAGMAYFAKGHFAEEGTADQRAIFGLPPVQPSAHPPMLSLFSQAEDE